MSMVEFAQTSQAVKNWSARLMVDAARSGYFTDHFAPTRAPLTLRQRIVAHFAEAKYRVQQAWSYLRHGYAKWED